MFLVENEPSQIMISATKSFFADPVVLIVFRCSKAFLNELPRMREIMMRVDAMTMRCLVFFIGAPL